MKITECTGYSTIISKLQICSSRLGHRAVTCKSPFSFASHSPVAPGGGARGKLEEGKDRPWPNLFAFRSASQHHRSNASSSPGQRPFVPIAAGESCRWRHQPQGNTPPQRAGSQPHQTPLPSVEVSISPPSFPALGVGALTSVIP